MVGWRSGTDVRDAVTLSIDLTCIVGLLAHERTTPQALRVGLVMETGLEVAGATGHLWHSLDYGAIDAQVRFLATEGRFVLLESLALTIARFLLLPPAEGEHRAAVAAVEVAIDKPDILPSSLPGVRLRRTSWNDDVLADLPEVSVLRRSLATGERRTAKDGAAWGLVGATGRVDELVGPAVVLEVRQRLGAPAVTLPGS
jgi:dihydroneopterin aldolase